MNSLRGELYKLMLRARSWREIEGEDSDYFADEILKLFEKLIDEKMNIYINLDNKLPYDYGCLETLQKLKKELKK